MTKCIHGGIIEQKNGAVNTPIQLSSTFAQNTPGNPKGDYEYSRAGNPTRNQLERNLASLENAKFALSFSSGLAAVDALSYLCNTQLVSVADVYGGTRRYFSTIAAKRNIELIFDDEMPISEKTDLVWIETPTNPTLQIHDIKKIVEKAHSYNALVVVDNTFMSPIFQNPIDLGADIVMHSVTKYLNGHSDVVGGCIMLNDENIYEKLKFHQYALGAVPSPFDCYLVLRGIKTLALRMKQHQENAMQIATFLSNEEAFDKVIYPGLESHPQHQIAKSQCKGFGGMISVYLSKEYDLNNFLSKLKIFTLAESLGAVESLVNVPIKMTHASVPEEKRLELGITDNLLRFSIGVENISDLINDLKQALK